MVRNVAVYRIVGKFGGYYIWRIDYFEVLAILIWRFTDHTRCFDGCGLGLSERLLESTADKCKREVLKSKKSLDVFEAIMFTSKFGHHSLEKN